MRALTDTEGRVLDAVTVLIDRVGYSPTVREVADHAALSVAVTHRYLHRLSHAARVTWEPHKQRTLRILGDRRPA